MVLTRASLAVLLFIVALAAACGGGGNTHLDAQLGALDATAHGTADAVAIIDATPAEDAAATEDAAAPTDSGGANDAAAASDEGTALSDTGSPNQDAGASCDDPDMDQHGPGCPAGPDCAPNDPARFDAITAYVDADGDGATVGGAMTLCTDGTLPPGYAAVQGPTDCDDTNASIHPGATEQADCVDQNCDGIAFPIGDGRDGTIVATSTNTETRANRLAATATAGDRRLSIAEASVFAPGDLALVLGIRGTHAGRFALYTAGSTTSTTTIVLTDPLNETWDSSTETWIVRVQQYTDVTVPNGALVAPVPWAGPNVAPLPGIGVIAWAVSGRLTIEQGGEISASGACYTGGAGSTVNTVVGLEGTSELGVPRTSTAANFTGGGGGKSPSLTNGCGGGGGHATRGADGDHYNGFSAMGGAGGGTTGTSSVTELHCGGGGGGGGLDIDAAPGSHGGNAGGGGGIVFLMVRELNLAGRISADGGHGANGVYFGNASPGGGGGGAGGTIYISTATVTGSIGQVSAVGGTGGVGTEAGGGRWLGGTGGAGRIRIETSGTIPAMPVPTKSCP